MARIDIDIEDHLDEVSTSNLIKELQARKDRKKVGRNLDGDEFNIYAELKIDNLSDVMKFEHFMKKFRNIPEQTIDDFLNQY